MATYTDAFTDTNFVLLENHTPTGGGFTWTRWAAFSVDSANIESNLVSPTGSSGGSTYYTNITPSDADYTIELDITAGSNPSAAPLARIDTTGFNFVYFGWNGTAWEVTEFIGGTPNSRGTSSSLSPASNARTVRLEVEGTAARGYVDDTLLVTGTLTTVTAAGVPGIGFGASLAADADNWSFDDAVSGSVPDTPTAGGVTALAPTSATVNWTDNSDDETGFKVEYAASPYSSWSAASGSPAAANATSLSITSFSPSTSYKFRVAGTNANGDSSWSESSAFTTPAWAYARPTSDISEAWSLSTGGDSYALLDETSADDGDYIAAVSSGLTTEVKLGGMSVPTTGTSVLVNYKVTGITGSGSVSVRLYCGSTLIKTDTTRTTNGTYTMTVTSAEWDTEVTDWSDMRLRFVSI